MWTREPSVHARKATEMNFSLSSAHLSRVLDEHVRSYREASPFPHTFTDHIFPRLWAEAVAGEVPERMDSRGCVPGAAACYRRKATHYRKSELHEPSFGRHTRSIFSSLRSQPFVEFLERLSGIPRLIPDPGYQGSGVHLIGQDGVLAVRLRERQRACCAAGSAAGKNGNTV